MILRNYQKKAKDTIKNEFKKGNKNVIMVMPTGAGKTVVFINMALESINTKGKRVMIVCDRKELIKQAISKTNNTQVELSIITPGQKINPNANLYIASIDTLRNRDKPVVDLIIIDECHKSTFDKIFEWYNDGNSNVYIIGATATPIRTGKMSTLSKFYTSLCEIVTTEELIELNYLVKARYYCAENDFSDLNKIGGDFNQGELFKGFNKKVMYDGTIENWLKFAKGLKTICFCVNQEHSELTAQSFRDSSIRSESLTSSMSDAEREDILYRFKTGEIDVLCNCGILTTGYDEPTIEAIIINRDTLSLSLFLQMCGRGSRLCEEINKTEFKIIDQGANLFRFGLWHQPRQWSLEINKKRNKSEDVGASPVKACPKCESLLYASARVCQYCNHEFEIKEKELYQSNFIEFGSGPIMKAEKRTTLKELKEIAQKRGYDSKWAYVQYNLFSAKDKANNKGGS